MKGLSEIRRDNTKREPVAVRQARHDLDARIAAESDAREATLSTMLRFQQRHADASFVVEQLRDMLDEQDRRIAALRKAKP